MFMSLQSHQSSEEDGRFPGDGVTGISELHKKRF